MIEVLVPAEPNAVHNPLECSTPGCHCRLELAEISPICRA